MTTISHMTRAAIVQCEIIVRQYIVSDFSSMISLVIKVIYYIYYTTVKLGAIIF